MQQSNSLDSIEIRQSQIIEEFTQFKSWEDRYKKIIEMGKTLPLMPEILKTEETKVVGCQSLVWISAEYDPSSERIIFVGDSDSILVKGMVALILKIYSNSSVTEILNTPPTFIKEIGLDSYLSPSRTNGLFSMIKKIILIANNYR